MILADRLVVPLNQRPWEWRATQLDDLFDDLVDTADRWCHPTVDGTWEIRSDTSSVLPHFFGPLVLEEDDGASAVVDGQQRCTATTVLIAAMRDIVEPYCDGQPAPVRTKARALRTAVSNWLMADPQSGDESPRLKLDSTVADFFDQYVIHSIGDEERSTYLSGLGADPVADAADVRQALIDATRHLGERLASHLAERQPDGDPAKVLSRLRALYSTLSEAFVVIVVRVRRVSMSPQLFAGLNARGTSLNEADKIKNELFLLSDATQHIEIKVAWDAVVRAAPDRDAETFLRVRHIAFLDDTKQADLYHNVRRTELQGTTILPVVLRWADDARLMRIAAGQEEHPSVSETTRRHLLDIRLQRHTYIRPLLLAAARAYLADDPDSFAEAALLARNAAFRELSVRRTQPETFLRRLGPIARAVASGGTVDALRQQLLDLSPDDDFRQRFASHHEERTAIQYYILYELELAAGSTGGLVPAPHSPSMADHANNIEHILPKTPSRRRTAEFAAWRDTDDPTGRNKNRRLHRQYFQRIGNLLLLESDINSELSDFDFPAKQDGTYPAPYRQIDGRPRRSYRQSALKLPRQLGSRAAWTSWEPEDVDRRQEILADLAVKAWRLAAPRRRTRAAVRR